MVENNIEKSCHTCIYFFTNSVGYAPSSVRWADCQLWVDEDDFPPVSHCPNFPFKNGCKRYKVEPMLVSEDKEEV